MKRFERLMKGITKSLSLVLTILLWTGSAFAAKSISLTTTGSGTVACSNGTGTAYTNAGSATMSFGNNDIVTCSMTADAGYYLGSVRVDSGAASQNSPVTINMANTTHTLAVTFAQVQNYSITSSVSGSGGTVSPATASVVSGANATVTITPNTGYVVNDVLADGGSVTGALVFDSGTQTYGYTFVNVQANHSLVASFSPVQTFTITASTGDANGTITPSGGVAVPNNGSQAFTIAANANYAILRVEVDGVSIGSTSSHTFANVNAAHTIRAFFTPAYTITATAGANGSISPAGSVGALSGGSKTFAITPNVGYVIDDVAVDGTGQGAISTYTFSNVGGNHTIHATFVSSGSKIANYCNTPPFLTANVKPNLLLMIDNSASMYDLANINAATYCHDDSYDNAKPYEGYFEQGTFYQYSGGKFLRGATLPNACTFRTTYACVNMTGTAPNRTVDNFVASGKFLNWLTASKLDIQKKALTGGKYDAVRNILIGESRGCVGRRFVKAVTALGDVTFAIRGPYALDADYVSQSTQGGETRIEIYDAAYNKEACLAAVTAWQDPDAIGDIQNITRDCVGTGASAFRTDAYNHVIHQCYWALTGDHSLANMNTLQGDCTNVYSLYDTEPANSTASYLAGLPARITNEQAADAVCGSGIRHPIYGNNSDNNEVGFLGRCVTITRQGNGNLQTSWNATCSDTEVRDFCSGIHADEVTDPSSLAAAGTSSPVAVPSFVIDAGVNALGNLAGSFMVHVDVGGEPTKLIQEFASRLNIGAMTFNYNGTASECNVSGTNIKCAKYCSTTTSRECFSNSDCPSGETCTLIPLTDGGKVISHIKYDSIGSHSSSGLIKSLDDLKATSWTPFGEAFYEAIGYFAKTGSGNSRSDLRLQAADYDITKNPSDYVCQKNFVLIISDGMSTADHNEAVNDLVATYHAPTGQTGWVSNSSPPYAGSRNLDDLAWLAQNKNIADFTHAPAQDRDKITTYVVYTGPPCNNGNACTAGTTDDIPEQLMRSTATNGGGQFYGSNDLTQLENKLREALEKIAGGASSGTAASILSNSEGSGANILQAVFYPKKSFDNAKTSVTWAGEMQNLWYYIDPFIGRSTVREDSDYTGSGNHELRLKNDDVADFTFNPSTKQTEVILYKDTNGDGAADATQPTGYPKTVSPDDLKSLWRAGKLLWSRDPATRTIYTQTTGSRTAFTDLDTSDDTVRSLLQASSQAEADKIIGFVKGVDQTGYRGRTIATSSATGAPQNVWKLGDIITSTPRIQSSIRLNGYNLEPSAGYSDTTYGDDSAKSGFIYTDDYKARGMAYVGANDGMLHAFKLGSLDVTAAGDLKATLSGTDLGKEEWAFIPKNALPYLKYLTDPDYPHLYYVDGATTIIDASIGCAGASYWDCAKSVSTWKTVLIGGMGLGGAAKNATATCGQDLNGDSVTDDKDCVKTPVTDLGYSSYFALDVTNPNDPLVMWEFTNANLGYATSGPSTVKISAVTDYEEGGGTVTKPDTSKNGRWFAVFASGPTGPINSATCQFQGYSDQNLRLFIVDLKTGTLLRTIDTGIQNAFAGTITTGVIDTDRWDKRSKGFYQDDSVYIGYVKKSASGSWTDGGVLRLVTKESLNVNDWAVSTVIDGIGPVTTAIAKLQDRKNHNLWLYFGTGRYFYNQDDKATTDPPRRLFGIKEPCYKASFTISGVTFKDDIDYSCTDAIGSVSLNLSDKTSDASDSLTAVTGEKGWFINLEGENVTDSGFGSERVITDPVAMTNGAVFFTTFKPTADPCQFGGRSYMWAAKYDTGATPLASSLQGKALVQVSTGSFEEIDLPTAFTQKGGRRMGTPMTGKPPSDPPPIVTRANLRPVKKIIHIQER